MGKVCLVITPEGAGGGKYIPMNMICRYIKHHNRNTVEDFQLNMNRITDLAISFLHDMTFHDQHDMTQPKRLNP